MNPHVDLGAAADFIWRNARVLERQVFAALFLGGDMMRALEALRPYQNKDGGFGNGLEPDIRGPVSQPVPTEFAFRTLDQVGAIEETMIGRACDYLQTVTTDEGGVPWVLPSVRDYPRAPWWETSDNPPASLNPTAAVAGLLQKWKIEHPWRDPATAFCWRKIDEQAEIGGYEVRSVLTFLEYVPDRARAASVFEEFGKRMLQLGDLSLDPDEPREVFKPLDFAPTPSSIARSLFAEEVIDAHLDALARLQQPAGGWPITYFVWTPATELEGGSWRTIEALCILRSYGRLGN